MSHTSAATTTKHPRSSRLQAQALAALNGAVREPAWKNKPSWYLVATDDKMIPPPAQRAMSRRAGVTVVEAKGSHAIYESNPAKVADLIKQAAHGARDSRVATRAKTP